MTTYTNAVRELSRQRKTDYLLWAVHEKWDTGRIKSKPTRINHRNTRKILSVVSKHEVLNTLNALKSEVVEESSIRSLKYRYDKGQREVWNLYMASISS